MFRQVSLRYIAAGLFAAIGVPAMAQQSGGGDAPSAAYTFEIAPMIGANLPYDLWGVSGTLNVFGVRTAYRLNNASGAIEASFFVHHKIPDKAYTTEVAYRHEIYSSFLNGYFDVGMHYSYYDLEVDYDGSGNCVPSNCQTDSGYHSGITYGGGIMLPVGQYPIKLGVRFYKKPQSWLLLELGYGIRI